MLFLRHGKGSHDAIVVLALCAVCYSAQIEADYRKYVARYGADIDLAQFVRLYWERSQGAKVKIAKAMDAAF